jgi:hypothetical protein
MKIEHAYDKRGHRWSIELDPWVERSIAFVVFSALTGGGALLLNVLKATLAG